MNNVSTKRIRLATCLVMALAVASLDLADAGQICSEAAAQKAAFPQADSFEKKLIVMDAEQLKTVRAFKHSKKKSRIYQYAIAKKDGTVLGYTVIDSMPGKKDPIRLMAALDPYAAVIGVKILDHAKSRGRAILKGGFLDQFRGKTVRDKVRAGGCIDAVTGATISSRATINGVRRILDLFSVLVPTPPVTSGGEDGPSQDCPAGSQLRRLE